jgi:hypothetical protein
MPVQEFNTTIKDIKYTSNSSGFKMSELSLALNNKAFIKSGEIFVAADSLRRGKVSIEMFASMNNEDQKIVSKNDTIHFSAAFSGSTDSLQIEKCNLDASSGIGLSVTGHIIDLLKLPDSRCEIKFNTKAITHDQATGLVALSGNRVNLPEFEPISFSGVVGNSILKPEFKLSVTSASGNIGLAGNYDIKNVNGELTASLSQVKLRKILGNEYPEWITCSLVLQGGLNNKKNINGKGVIEIDSVLYKDAISRKINIELSADNNQGHFKISANDTAITCMLNGLFGWEGRNYTGSLSGNFSLNENHNKLLPNYLAIRGEIDASFKSSGNNLESCLEMKNIGVSNLNSEANLKKFSVNLNMDDNSVNSQLETDFLTAGFKSMSSFNNLKNTIESIGFEKILSLDSADFLKLKAVSNLPVFNLAATVHYNSFFQLFYPDSVFNFQSINVAMDKKMEGNSVQSEITVDGFKYFNYKTYGAKMEMKLEEDKLNCKIILDSLDADSVLIGSSAVTLDILPTNMLGTISISDRKGLPLYQLGAETHKGRDKLIFKSTGSDWVINSGTWTMSPSEFLTRENATGDMVADLHLHHDDMKIDLSGRKSESMKLDIQNVSLSKVVSPVLIKDLPDGSITANVIYKEDNKKHLDFKFDIDQFKWKDVLINRIESKGKLLADTSGIIESNIVTNINDSSTITITSNTANNFHSTFNNVPVRILEPVLSEYINKMQGVVSGEVTLAGENNKSTIDGEIKLQKISLNVIPLKSWFSIPGDKILIKKNQIYFDHFTVLDSMQKQMNLDGKINLENPDDITCDLNLKLDDLRIMNTTVKDNPGFFGSIVVKSGLEISGPVKNPEIKGKVALENGTNITYRQIQDLTIKELQKTITFQKLNSDSIDNGFQKVQLKNISGVPLVQTVIEITPKSIFNVEITGGFENKITVSGSGLLNYSMLPNNTISLTGSYEVKTGTSELKFTGWPKKYFSITPGSSLRWDGKVDDPELNLEATSKVKGAYTNPIDNSNRNVDFIVSMKLSDQLSQLKLVFDVKSEDQYITSVLSSLAPDELMRQAVNLVLFEAIDLPGFESSTSYASAQMNSFWESQLNNLTKTSFKNVDLSFGIDTRKQVSAGGAEEEKTSLSYELERKLLNDRASVKLSGRVNDDTQPGEQSANVIENFIFEYELDTFNRKFLKIYRKQDYEDILEGEVIKSGAGFIYRKTYPKLSDIWKRKEKQKDASGQSSDKHE